MQCRWAAWTLGWCLVSSGARLSWFVVAVLGLNVMAAVVAIVVNWPAQFDGVGMDAESEFLSRGTAISAPLLPVVLLVIAAVLSHRGDAWHWVGFAGAYLAGILLVVGAVGEFTATGTADTPRSVLMAAGVAWSIIAVLLILLATVAVLQRRHRSAVGETAVQP